MPLSIDLNAKKGKRQGMTIDGTFCSGTPVPKPTLLLYPGIITIMAWHPTIQRIELTQIEKDIELN